MSDYVGEKLTVLRCVTSVVVLAAPTLVLVALLDQWQKRRDHQGSQR